MIPVHRTEGPGLCHRPGCPIAATHGYDCDAHAMETARAQGRARKAREPYTGPGGGRPPLRGLGKSLYWVDLDEVSEAVADAPEWAPGGLCSTPHAGGAQFFFEGPTAPAKRVCAQCPNLFPCLGRALRDDEQFGVWGGCSRPERVRIRNALRRRRAAATTPTTAVG